MKTWRTILLSISILIFIILLFFIPTFEKGIPEKNITGAFSLLISVICFLIAVIKK